MPSPTIASAPASASSSPAPSAPAAASRSPSAQDFRARLDPRRNERAPHPRGHHAQGLLEAPDGSLVIPPTVLEFRRTPSTPTARGADALQGIAGKIDQLRWGAGRDETRLHVRLAEGPFEGVEVRGVQSGRSLRIEIATDACRAPIDLGALAQHLAARGIHGVDLSFADARDAPRRQIPVADDLDDAPDAPIAPPRPSDEL